MDSPVVSVCIATYNQDRYIGDCIASVLAQAADVKLEVIIGDDGVGQNTPEIVAALMVQYPGVIQYFRNEVNFGPARNYQMMVAKATGEYIAHLDGDDFWLPGKIRRQLAWLESNPESVACYSNAVVIDDTGEMRGIFGPPVRGGVDLADLLSSGNFLNHSSMLYRARYKHVIAAFDEPFIDYKIHLHFAKIAPLGFVNAALTVYRMGSEHSMIRNTPALVQELYFDALASVLACESVSDSLRVRALTNFYRSIVLEAMVRVRVGWFFVWTRKIWRKYPRDFSRVFCVGVLAAIWNLQHLIKRKLIAIFFQSNDMVVLHER